MSGGSLTYLQAIDEPPRQESLFRDKPVRQTHSELAGLGRPDRRRHDFGDRPLGMLDLSACMNAVILD